MKQKAWTRLLALLLSIAMVMTCLPLTVFAADNGGGTQATATTYYLAFGKGPNAQINGWYFTETPTNCPLFTFTGEQLADTDNTVANASSSIDEAAYYVITNSNKALSAPYDGISYSSGELVWTTVNGGVSGYKGVKDVFFALEADPANDGYYAIRRVPQDSDTEDNEDLVYLSHQNILLAHSSGRIYEIKLTDEPEYFKIENQGKNSYQISYTVEPDPIPADKTALEAAIAEAGTLTEGVYTADSWAVLHEALDSAKDVYAAADATQDEVDAARDALTAAINNLEENPAETDPPETEPVDTETPGSVTQTYASPAEAEAAGMVVTYLAFNSSPRYWSSSNSKYAINLYQVNGELSEVTTSTAIALDTNGIDNGKGYVIVAPDTARLGIMHNRDHYTLQCDKTTTTVTCYNTGNSESHVFVFEAADGGYSIRPLLVTSNEYLSLDGNSSNNRLFKADKTIFYITPAANPNDGAYYIWTATEPKTPVNPDPGETETPAPVETIEHHTPTAGMVQHYLHYVSPGWGGPTAKAALELHNVADGTYTKDTDGVINSGIYGIYDTNPGDGGSKRWMHAGSGVTNQCGGNTCGAAHQFTFTYNAEKRAYTIKSVSTGSYLTQTASGNQLAMNSTPTYFYIDPVEGSAGSYYIWWETEAVPGDAVSGMLSTAEADNTWAFVGGRAVQGSFDDIGLARTLAGQFEEYIRWEKRGNANDEQNRPQGMQRYVTNAAYTGQTLANVVSDAGWARVTALKPRAAVYMAGDEDIGSATFEADLNSFITKSLALRDGSGFAVIIKGYKTEMTELNAAVDTVVSALPASQKSRVAVVDGTLTADQLSNGYPNAKGHLELAKRLATAVVGSTNSFPTGRNDAAAIANGAWANKLTDTGVTIFGKEPETLTAAQQAVKDKVEDKTTPMTWLFMGDSITHGALWAEGDGTISQDFEKFVKDDLGRASDVVINTAVSGATSATTVREIETRLNKYDPDVVSIMIGTNDAAGKRVSVANYKSNLNTIVTAILNKNAIAVLRTPIPDGANGRGNYIHEYVDAIWEVYNGLTDTQKEKVIVVDQFAQWAPYLMTADDGTGITFLFGKVFDQDANKIHPGPVGHLWMTQELIDGLGLWDSSKNLCKLSYQQDWGITSENSTVSLADACTYDADSRTLSVSLSKLNLSGAVISAELAANVDGKTYKASYLRGQEETLTITIPEDATGLDNVQISANALVSVSISAGKKVSFAPVTADLSKTIEDDGRFAAPELPTVYEYRRANGAIEPGVYMLAASTWEANSSQKCRVMHLWYNNSNQLKVDQCGTGDDGTAEILSLVHETHLIQVEEKNGGYTFKSYAGNAAGKYLTASSSGVSLGNTATVFTVTEAEDGGYYLSVDGSYISWNSNWTTSATPYRLNLYRETEVKPDMAQTEFSGASTEGPLVRNDTKSYFRIPSLITLDNGWIMASSDIRWCGTGDNPANIDTVVSISKDNGETWNWEVINYFSDHAITSSGSSSTAFIDPAFVQASDGKIWMAVDATPAYGGNMSGNRMIPIDYKENKGFDDQGRMIVGYITDVTTDSYHPETNGKYTYDYYVDLYGTDSLTANDGKAYEVDGNDVTLYPICAKSSNSKTGYYVDAFANTYYDYGEDNGGMKPVLAQQMGSAKFIHNNLFYLQSEWKVPCTFYLMVRSATITDDGLEWSDPYFANVKNLHGEGDRPKLSNERFTGICPGRGTIAKLTGGDGKPFERIIFPLYDNVTTETASIMYSDDGGVTWQRGGHAGDFNGSGKSSESQIVVLPNGDLRMYSRNTKSYISYTDSSDGGETWGQYTMDNGLFSQKPGSPNSSNGCMVSFINVEGYLIDPNGNVYTNLIMGSYARTQRSIGVIRIGYIDENEAGYPVHWVDNDDYLITKDNSFAYSCLAQLRNKDGSYRTEVAVLPELNLSDNTGLPYMLIDFSRLLGDDWNWVLEKPGEDDIPTLEVTGITGSKVNTADNALVDLDVDGEATVSVDFTPDSATVNWSSSDGSVATVESGLIKAVKAGKALITASVINKGITTKAVIEVVVQDGGSITLPERYANELGTATVPAKTRYELDTDGDLSGVYAIFSQGSGARIMYNNTSKTDHCQASPVNGVLTSISCHTTNLHLWKVAKQADGTYTIQGVSNSKYLTTTANGTQLSLGDSPVSFTITHQGNGTYYVGSGGSYLAWSNGWKMQSTAFNIQFFEQINYPESSTYTTNADGLKAVIAALGKDEADYAGTLALVATFNDKAEADEAQAKIDALTKQLYRELRGDAVTVTCEHTTSRTERENAVEATCEANGSYDEVVYCAECGEELSRETIVVEAAGHTEQTVEGKDATCTETGLTEGAKCSVCGETLTAQEVIPATVHTVVIDPEIPATETSTGLTAGSHCSVCDTILVAQKEIPMLEPAPETPEDPETPETPLIPAAPVIVPSTPNNPDIPDDPDTPDDPDDPVEEIVDPETPLANLPFIDVDEDAWYAESVAYVYSKNIMHGMDSMIFAPKASLTRGMMAQIIHNMAENPETDASSIFSDLNDRYYTEAVAWGVANGVLKGYSEDTFGGEDDLTREQMAVMLYRYAQVQGLGSDVDVAALDSFADGAQVSGWAKEAMAWAVKNGLLKGRGNNDLDPRTNITRSEVAAVLERYLKMFLA